MNYLYDYLYSHEILIIPLSVLLIIVFWENSDFVFSDFVCLHSNDMKCVKIKKNIQECVQIKQIFRNVLR